MWDANTGRMVQHWSNSENVTRVIFSADGTRLAISAEGGRGQLLDARTGNLVVDLGPVDSGTSAMQFSADGSRLTVIGPQATGVLWDARSGERIANFSEKDTVSLMQLAPDASRLVIQSFDQKTSVWDGLSGRKIADLNSIDKIQSAMFSTATGPLLLRTLGSASLLTHDGATLVDFGMHQSHALVSSGVSEIDNQMSRDGRYLAGLDGDGMVRIWNTTQPPISGDGDALRLRICSANRRATPAFRREDRESGSTVAYYLKGRPWNVCDWRGFNEPAGWLQTLRYWGTKVHLIADYAENN